MAVRREDEGHIDSFAGGISLCLLKTMTGWESLSLCLYKRYRYGLTLSRYPVRRV